MLPLQTGILYCSILNFIQTITASGAHRGNTPTNTSAFPQTGFANGLRMTM